MNAQLLKFLTDSRHYPGGCQRVERIETHISDVFLTGCYAYKFKKAVRFDFLDFSTLGLRKKFCEREVALNRRFAPEVYRRVVAISQHGSSFRFDDDSAPVEYAVEMLQFDPHDLFSGLLARGELSSEMLIALTRNIVAFHSTAERTPERWSIETVSGNVHDSIEVLRRGDGCVPIETVEALSADLQAELSRHAQLIERRRAYAVKALHGDLHLRNICLFRGQPQIFDGIEFNEELACCDVWADIAFLIMDLHYRQRADLAWMVVCEYLEALDDFEGLALLNLYCAYRALVRAKVSVLEWSTSEDARVRDHARQSAELHVALAREFLAVHPRWVLAVGGFSGSGKSTLSRVIATKVGAVHIRSDAVRKHLGGVPLTNVGGTMLYTPEMTVRTYDGMRVRGERALSAGHPIILDGVHAERAERDAARTLAERNKVPFHGVWCEVDISTALARVRAREGDVSDADERIVRAQFGKSTHVEDWIQLDTTGPFENTGNTVVEMIRGTGI